jgi:hypothetical protein
MCHHELRTPSWRQQRLLSAGLTPGRPQLQRWPAALVDVALVRVAGGNTAELQSLQKQFASQQAALQAIFNKSPFGVGQEAQIAAASESLVKWLDALVERAAGPFDRAASEAVLIDVCQSALRGEYNDYDSARQLAWAIRTLWRQLDPPPGDKAAAEKALEDLAKDLKLELPWGQAKQILDPAEQKTAFAAATGYDPERFQQTVKQFLDALGPPGAVSR